MLIFSRNNYLLAFIALYDVIIGLLSWDNGVCIGYRLSTLSLTQYAHTCVKVHQLSTCNQAIYYPHLFHSERNSLDKQYNTFYWTLVCTEGYKQISSNNAYIDIYQIKLKNRMRIFWEFTEFCRLRAFRSDYEHCVLIAVDISFLWNFKWWKSIEK